MERLNQSTTVVREVLKFSLKQLNIVIVNIIDIILVDNIVIFLFSQMASFSILIIACF